MTNDEIKACHSERSRGIRRQTRKEIPRGPSTPLRFAKDDDPLSFELRHYFVIRDSSLVIFSL
jgi:hypothetical protein